MSLFLRGQSTGGFALRQSLPSVSLPPNKITLIPPPKQHIFQYVGLNYCLTFPFALLPGSLLKPFLSSHTGIFKLTLKCSCVMEKNFSLSMSYEHHRTSALSSCEDMLPHRC